jgi:hypothetical protein
VTRPSAVFTWVSLLSVVFESSCDEPKQAGPPAAAVPSSAAAALKGGGGYEVGAVASPGALGISVVYTGDPIPEPTEVPTEIDAAACGHKVLTESLLVDRGTRGLKNVVVRLEGIAKGKAPSPLITVTSRNCAFEPHVGVAVKGMKLAVRNADPVLHATHPFLAGASFFEAQLPPNAEAPPVRPIPRAGLMEISCDVHKWMRAYVVVHTNPYVGVTDRLGKLRIDGIPPGKYPYVAWHESLGEKKGELEITAGKTVELQLEFAPPK